MKWVKQKVLGIKPLYIYNGLKYPWYIAQVTLQSNRGKQYTLNIAIPITWQGKWLQKFLSSIKNIEIKEEHPKKVFECIDSVSKTTTNNETTIVNVPVVAEAEKQLCEELGDKVTVVPLEFVWVNFNTKQVLLFPPKS